MKRTIHTDYYLRDAIVKSTRARHASTAVANAVRHMQWNDYGASHCEVYDTVDGAVVYAQLRQRLAGTTTRLEIVYEHEGVTAIRKEKSEQERADQSRSRKRAERKKRADRSTAVGGGKVVSIKAARA